MNPKHIELLGSAIQKFGVLSTRQAFSLFEGVLSQRSVRYCIATLKRQRRIASFRNSWVHDWLYVDRSDLTRVTNATPDSGFPVIDSKNLGHRLVCNDVYLALARCALVSEITSEYEMNRFKIPSPVNNRKPDGFFKIAHPGESPMLVAIEVESTWRNKDRIRSLVETYVQAYRDRSCKLNGVLIVGATPGIVSAYQNAVTQVFEPDREIFIISAHSDLSDVRESTLGQRSFPLSERSQTLIKSSCSPLQPISHILEMT